MDIRFVTKNPHKVDEVQKLLTNTNVIHCPLSIDEIQSENINDIVDDKIIKAFKRIGRPVFIEHTSLYLRCLNGLPGGLTQVFWDKLQADKFSTIINSLQDSVVEAKTIIGYCDAKKIYRFEGSISGTIATTPIGNRDFQWDCVFIPNGHDKTFAEMGEERKNEISMRMIAFSKFNEFLKRG